VATIGPASEDPEVLDKLLALGVDTVRVNYSHGTIESKTEIIARLRAAEEKSGR
jgi:pyruvate kinase